MQRTSEKVARPDRSGLSRSQTADEGAKLNQYCRSKFLGGLSVKWQLLSILITSALLGGIQGSSAADLPLKAPPPAVAVYNWTGCYIGGNAGGAWARSRDSWTGITETPAGAFAAGAATVIPAAANANLKPDGVEVGGQIGCNIQKGAHVFGVEGDIQYTDLDTTRTAVSLGNTNGGPPTIVPGNIAETFTSHWLSTIRGRVGYATGPALLYVTGGVAIADLRLTDQLCFPAAGVPTCNNASISDTRVGWTVGGGVEWMLKNNWSIKGEYLYVDLGSATSTSTSIVTATGLPIALPNNTITHNHDLTENIVRVGLNYKLNWAGPVVAKY
jgi:outer membrane immunogenic protein